ncbi:MAG: bifunctional oligoribonuclease/PAP phosphatase NrnA, partial [Rikenellaceae bacterium]|nr:bifunctional oligoribonuclease/PAP phosphatase NrnA [Rikenellaceae bacterium]
MNNTAKEVVLSTEDLDRLKLMLAPSAQRIIILSHTNPDGDAVGSSLAWCRVLQSMGHDVMCVVPNRFPYFLNW